MNSIKATLGHEWYHDRASPDNGRVTEIIEMLVSSLMGLLFFQGSPDRRLWTERFRPWRTEEQEMGGRECSSELRKAEAAETG